MSMPRRALVLAAGGSAAIAWEIGVIAGLAEAGIDLRTADLFVGTSAGSVVAAQITSGRPLDALFQHQVDPQLQLQELPPPVDFHHWHAAIMRTKEGSEEAVAILQRVGALALATQTVSEAERRTVIAARLPLHIWPEARLLVVAVDTESGERRVFDRTSGVNLIDAVAASCAVPGMWPPVTIGRHRYMDGGVYSTDNADLAVGYDRILILALPPRVPPLAVMPLDAALQRLQRSGAQVEVVRPDEATEAAFASVGGNLLDPAVRERAARAGRAQGRSIAARYAAVVWQ
jgi:NTE family protein